MFLLVKREFVTDLWHGALDEPAQPQPSQPNIHVRATVSTRDRRAALSAGHGAPSNNLILVPYLDHLGHFVSPEYRQGQASISPCHYRLKRLGSFTCCLRDGLGTKSPAYLHSLWSPSPVLAARIPGHGVPIYYRPSFWAVYRQPPLIVMFFNGSPQHASIGQLRLHRNFVGS